MSEFVTPAQAAAQLKMNVNTVRGLINSGSLRASNVSRGKERPRWRISVEELASFAQRRSNKPTPKRTTRRRQLPEVPNYV